MPIRLGCVKCNKPFVAGDDSAGQVVRCPSCQQAMRVPKAAAPPPEPEPIAVAEVVEDEPRREEPDDAPRPRRRDRLDDDVREMQERERESDRTKPLPDDLAEEAKDLGRPVYHVDEGFNWRLLAFFPGGVAVIITVLIIWMTSVRHNGLANVKEPPPWPPIVIVVVCALAAVPIAVFARKSIKERWICPGGIVWRKGKNHGCEPYENVRFFQPKTTTVITQQGGVEVGRHQIQTCQIGFRGNVTFEFEGFDKVGFLQRRVLLTLYPIYRERLDAGDRVRLAPFDLTAKWLGLDGDKVPWRDIQELYVHNNQVCALGYDNRYWYKIPLAEVDMALVLVVVSNELIKEVAPPPRDPEPRSSQSRSEGRRAEPPREERNPFDFG